MYIAYSIWRQKGNEGKDPTEYARSIKEQVYQVAALDQKRSQQDSEFIGNSQMINEIEKNSEAFQLEPNPAYSLMPMDHYDGFLDLQRQQAHAQAAEQQEHPQNKMDLEDYAQDSANPLPDKQDQPDSV